MIPSSGKARKGTSAVAVSGSASVIHQQAISTMIAVVRQAAGDIPSGAGSSSMTTKAASPPHRPQRAAIHFPPCGLGGDGMGGSRSQSRHPGESRDLGEKLGDSPRGPAFRGMTGQSAISEICRP